MPASVVNYKPRYQINRSYVFHINGLNFNFSATDDASKIVTFTLEHDRLRWRVLPQFADPAPTLTAVYVRAILENKPVPPVAEGDTWPEPSDDILPPFVGTGNLTIVVTNPTDPAMPGTPTPPDPSTSNDTDETP